ncbi:MAG: hypoxanthine phosphoribosyltransferase [Candidatus Aminicenantes bacterium]|nr:hypoxanthine phosphoribosyltransferase [Candidatus Aminicenantes bacterium]
MNHEIDYGNIIKVPEEGINEAENYIEALSKISSDKKNRIDRVLIPEKCLRKRIQALAQEICRDYKNAEELILVIILKGAFVFASDLGREIYKIGGLQETEIRYGFIKAMTYGKEIKHTEETTREVKIELMPQNLEGKDVLLIEDIVDQGFTLFEIKQKMLKEQKPKSLKICALINKRLKNPPKEVREIKNKLILDYLGFEIPDRWIAGYGIDAGEDFRHLPFIISVNENYYLNK